MNSAYDEAINLVPYINSKGQTVKNKNGDLQLIQQVNKKEKVEPYPEIIDLELYNGPNKQKFIKNKKFPMMTKGSITIDKKDNSGRITRKNIPLGKKAPLASKAAVASKAAPVKKAPLASKGPPSSKAPLASKAPVPLPVVSKAPVSKEPLPVVSQGPAPISDVRSNVKREILQNENYESVLALNQATTELAEAIMSDQNASPDNIEAAQDAENLVNAALQSAEENALAEAESPIIQRRNYSENKTELNNLINRLDSFIATESGMPLPLPSPAVLSGADINGCPPIELLISWLKYLHSFNYEKKYIEKMNLINTDTFADDIIKPEIVKALEEIKNIPKKGMFQKQSTYYKLLNLKAVEYIESQRVKYNDCEIKRYDEINEYDQTQFNKNIFEYFNSLLTRYNNNKFDIFEELKRIAADPTIDSTIQKFVKNKIDTKYFEFMVVFNDIDNAYWPEGGDIQKGIINKQIIKYLTKFSKIAKFKVGDRVEYYKEGYTAQNGEPEDWNSPDFKYQGTITDVDWSIPDDVYMYKIRITNNDGIDDYDLIKQNYQVGSVVDVYRDEEYISLLPAMGGGGRRRKTKRNKKKTNKKKTNKKKTKTNKKKTNKKKTKMNKKKTKRNKKKTKRNYK